MIGFFGATLKGVAFGNFPALRRAFGFLRVRLPSQGLFPRPPTLSIGLLGKKIAIRSTLESQA
jgi:hypothetical protein